VLLKGKGNMQMGMFNFGNAKQMANQGIGLVGVFLNSSAAILENDNKLLSGLKNSKHKIKLNNIGLKNIGKISKGLGLAASAIQVISAGNDYVNGDGITASSAVDIAVGVALTFLVFSNPAALIGFGIYGLLDASGALDPIKSALGGNKIIIKKGADGKAEWLPK
jgi:hypothetical protein